ncbi:MAG: ATP-binding protein [Bacteroidota bacterium]
MTQITRIKQQELTRQLGRFPVVCITGPRQCGKTTLARMLIQQLDRSAIFLDMEDARNYNTMDSAPLFFDDHQDELIVIDEVQRRPELFPQIRYSVDQHDRPGRFLLLGSAAPELIRTSGESLAGRIFYMELGPFSLPESGNLVSDQQLHFSGGFPRVLMSTDSAYRSDWLEQYIRTYIEKDLPLLGLSASPVIIRRLWEMLAWQNGSLFNSSELGRSLGLNAHTVNRYIGYLENAYLVQRLQPWYLNIGKRVSKSPKIYIRDTGILHRLLQLNDFDQLLGHPALGSSWESFVISQIGYSLPAGMSLFFYRTLSGNEMDLVICGGSKVLATAEIKYSTRPSVSRGQTTAIADLSSPVNFIITPGTDDYRIREDITVTNTRNFLSTYLPRLQELRTENR